MISAPQPSHKQTTPAPTKTDAERVADLRREGERLWFRGDWLNAAWAMRKADHLERGGLTPHEYAKKLRREECAALARTWEPMDREGRRKFIIQLRQRFTASEMAYALGVSRSTVIGISYRARADV